MKYFQSYLTFLIIFAIYISIPLDITLFVVDSIWVLYDIPDLKWFSLMKLKCLTTALCRKPHLFYVRTWISKKTLGLVFVFKNIYYLVYKFCQQWNVKNIYKLKIIFFIWMYCIWSLYVLIVHNHFLYSKSS